MFEQYCPCFTEQASRWIWRSASPSQEKSNIWDVWYASDDWSSIIVPQMQIWYLKAPGTLMGMKSYLGFVQCILMLDSQTCKNCSPLNFKIEKGNPNDWTTCSVKKWTPKRHYRRALNVPAVEVLWFSRWEGDLTLNNDSWDKRIGCVLMQDQPDCAKKLLSIHPKLLTWKKRITTRFFVSMCRSAGPATPEILSRSANFHNQYRSWCPSMDRQDRWFDKTYGQVRTPSICTRLCCSTQNLDRKLSCRHTIAMWNRRNGQHTAWGRNLPVSGVASPAHGL